MTKQLMKEKAFIACRWDRESLYLKERLLGLCHWGHGTLKHSTELIWSTLHQPSCRGTLKTGQLGMGRKGKWHSSSAPSSRLATAVEAKALACSDSVSNTWPCTYPLIRYRISSILRAWSERVEPGEVKWKRQRWSYKWKKWKVCRGYITYITLNLCLMLYVYQN